MNTMLQSMALILVTLLPCSLAASDFASRMDAADDLCREGRHEEAVAAYVALAKASPEVERRYEALSAAARCARLHLSSEARALELCGEIGDPLYAKACRAVVYQWASSPARVIEDLGEEDLTLWPEELAATGFMVRGQAHYNLDNGKEAVDDFVRAYQFSRGRDKWAALQRLGDTFWHRLDDEILAEACYRKCMSDSGLAWPGLQSRVNLGSLLLAQQRHDAALQVFTGAPGATGTWRAALLIGAARVHAATGQPDAARSALNEAIQVPGIHAWQKEEAEKLLDKIGVEP
ncbi:MAG: tetratricopeptide repeat protein [Thermoguttaceae bacterium]|jgi:tetratricopeptide (TPR) repeat protein|nr:tetratricopeptide repeat protein [Thermoguttaceae bacterium]